MPQLSPFICCPIDQQPLEQNNQQLTCCNGHSYDLAKQGYVNLLPVQHKKSKHPGDNKAMVQARNRFLSQDYYSDIITQLLSLLSPHIQEDSLIIDAGCGEGYYLNELSKHMKFNAIGFDISKFAIQQAAKRNQSMSWLVCSNKQPPITAHQCDILLCMFGFPHYPSFQTLLKKHGYLVMVDPGEQHLIEIRELIYPNIKRKDSVQHDNPHFRHCQTDHIQSSMTLTQSSIQDLLLMTPHLHKATHEGKAKLASCTSLDITIDVNCSLYQVC